jgi:hypothetical protein
MRPTSGVRALYFRGSAPQRDPGKLARGGAIFGMVSAGLLLGGSIAIALVDDFASERSTRGAWVGLLAVSAPFVAVSGWSARRRMKVQGYKQLRVLGWTTWTLALANGVLQWYESFHHEQPPVAITMVLGGLGALALLPLSFDAFASGHRATMKARIGLGMLPGGAGMSLRMRF